MAHRNVKSAFWSQQTKEQQVNIVNLSLPIRACKIIKKYVIFLVKSRGVFSPANLFQLKILVRNNEIVCQIDGCIQRCYLRLANYPKGQEWPEGKSMRINFHIIKLLQFSSYINSYNLCISTIAFVILQTLQSKGAKNMQTSQTFIKQTSKK